LGDIEKRLIKLEERPREPRDITIKVCYFDTVTDSTGESREVEVAIPDCDYVFGPWQILPNGDRLRIMEPKEMP
jgi:hypothetical protein